MQLSILSTPVRMFLSGMYVTHTEGIELLYVFFNQPRQHFESFTPVQVKATDKRQPNSLVKSYSSSDCEHTRKKFELWPQHCGSKIEHSDAVFFPEASGWLSLACNRPTWVTCRFHLAEWPSCHIPKDIGAGLAKRYGWVMGCRPHPDTLRRWGAAAKP